MAEGSGGSNSTPSPSEIDAFKRLIMMQGKKSAASTTPSKFVKKLVDIPQV